MLFILLLAFSISCTKINDSNSSENIIKELVFKYPELTKNYQNEKSTFILARQIIDNEWQFEIELYNNPTNNTGILIVRKDFQSYSIPLFASDQSYYWQMQYRGSAPTTKQNINTTFEQELKASNKKLKISKINFMYFRYIFIHVLQLDEDLADENNNRKTRYPIKTAYSGRYKLVETLHSRDSLSLISEPVYSCAYDYFNK